MAKRRKRGSGASWWSAKRRQRYWEAFDRAAGHYPELRRYRQRRTPARKRILPIEYEVEGIYEMKSKSFDIVGKQEYTLWSPWYSFTGVLSDFPFPLFRQLGDAWFYNKGSNAEKPTKKRSHYWRMVSGWSVRKSKWRKIDYTKSTVRFTGIDTAGTESGEEL